LVSILFVGCDTSTSVQESQPNPYKVDQQFEKAMNEAYRGVTRESGDKFVTAEELRDNMQNELKSYLQQRDSLDADAFQNAFQAAVHGEEETSKQKPGHPSPQVRKRVRRLREIFGTAETREELEQTLSRFDARVQREMNAGKADSLLVVSATLSAAGGYRLEHGEKWRDLLRSSNSKLDADPNGEAKTAIPDDSLRKICESRCAELTRIWNKYYDIHDGVWRSFTGAGAGCAVGGGIASLIPAPGPSNAAGCGVGMLFGAASGFVYEASRSQDECVVNCLQDLR